ncbi:MAG: methylmalonyl Co-A mutase-associated GTPase MeaB [Chloroflexi bacterium]|nr:methylmalonyl Co-A mutase-associated GTPase MeaB [Chloroflexota bacterium]
MSTPTSCVPSAWPASSGPGRPSPRWRSSFARTFAHATEVSTSSAPATGVAGADPAARARVLTDAATNGDRRALARLLTAVENRTPIAEAALRVLYPKAGRAHIVGITGAPGAGKSTLVAVLIAEARRAGRAVGVVAVDPSSPITGGALLGDRVRMQAHAADADVFIRSMASRGHAGGLAATSAAAAAVLDACDFDLVLIETVGTGQSEVEVAAAADTTVVLEAPEMGDEIQAIKAGLLEVADIVVVNKGDRPGAQRTASQLRAMLVAVARVGAADRGHHGATEGSVVPPSILTTRGRPRPKQPEVLITTATSGDGIPELLAALNRHRGLGREGPGAAARLARAQAQVWSILAERTRASLAESHRRAGTTAILQAVADHELDPFAAADRLLATLRE